MPGMKIKIMNEMDVEVAHGEAGILYVQGPQVFTRYWGKSPEEIAKEFKDGWFNTGDIATYNSAVDSIKIIGRASVDIIKTAGYKVSALDVEREILGHPSVAEVAVVGVPNAVYGEVVGAVVGLRPDTSLTVEELLDFLKGKLAHYRMPRKVIFVSSIPRNAMQKVNKKELKKLF